MNTLLGELGEQRVSLSVCLTCELATFAASPCVARTCICKTSLSISVCVLFSAATLNDVQFQRYRVAFKFRKLQKNLYREFGEGGTLVRCERCARC